MAAINTDPTAPPDHDPGAGTPSAQEPGWRRARLAPSLAEVHRSVNVNGATWFRKMVAFAGPGYLVAVGYMDPGNWATDLAGGSRFGYTLLSVILLSNLMAVLLQGLASKLGIVTGRDLAQACRDHYSPPVAFGLWVLCEIAIAACDLAEVIGTAIALNLLFGITLPVGIAITAVDVLIVLYLQNKGFRMLEALVIALIAVVVLFTGSMLGVLPEEIAAPGDTLRKIAFDAFDQQLPPALCKTYPFLADIFGNCR